MNGKEEMAGRNPAAGNAARALLEACRRAGLVCATAESCTGGMIGGAITAIPGSSEFYKGGIVSYSNEAKAALLGVRGETLSRHGAVSAECAGEMAAGACKALDADCAVAVTGIAGPGGGTAEKPVGLVFIASARRGRAPTVTRHVFPGGRDEVRGRTVETALAQLTAEISATPTMRIDMHTHAFADKIAAHAMESMMSHMPTKYWSRFDGRLGTLLAQLRGNGFGRAVLCQIATKPEHFTPIVQWSRAIRDGALGEEAARMLVPLPSIHPEDPERFSRLAEVAKEGFKGVKLHPFFQRFTLDSDGMLDYLKCARDCGLFVEVHTGFDVGFPFEDICGPRRVARVIEQVPGLRFMVTHFGGWLAWEEASRLLIGQPIDIEISMSIGFCEPSLLKEMILRHPEDRLYFGSDWPWSDYAVTLPFLEGLGLPESRMAALMGGNAARWLSAPAG